MKKTNNTKKAFKPAYVVDITTCKTADDVLLAFAEAKQKAGLAINDDELNAIIAANSVIIIVETESTCVCHETAKKQNIFKRFWNWLRGRK